MSLTVYKDLFYLSLIKVELSISLHWYLHVFGRSWSIGNLYFTGLQVINKSAPGSSFQSCYKDVREEGVT